ncbi:MAG: XRE family transcriptional regulator [Pseudomonadota bacterium]
MPEQPEILTESHGEPSRVRPPAIAGQQARALRRAKGLTLDRLAARTDLSKGHLSRFERGQKSLSVAALMRIAAALDTSVGRLLGEDVSPGEIRHVRATDMTFRMAGTEDSRHRFALLSEGSGSGGKHEAFLLELEAGEQRAASAFHAGTELLYLLAGRLRITIGARNVTLEAGDYVEFPGSVPHVLASIADRSRCLLIIVPDAP